MTPEGATGTETDPGPLDPNFTNTPPDRSSSRLGLRGVINALSNQFYHHHATESQKILFKRENKLESRHPPIYSPPLHNPPPLSPPKPPNCFPLPSDAPSA